MDDRQLARYSRQLLLPEIDIPGQERLLAARALIVGAGGLGSPAALYLAASGVGHITICDDDEVELSNLQRQILHGESDLGRNKASSAADTLRGINPGVSILPLSLRLRGEALRRETQAADVVVDGSDNFPTRYALNAACLANATPLVSGAVSRWTGQATAFLPGRVDSPCLTCLYPEDGEDMAGDCNEQGILAPVAGVIGSILAAEALKILLGLDDILCGRLLRFDAASMRFHCSRFRKDPACPACSAEPARAGGTKGAAMQ